ncbi:MAG TPA: hypothetical protein VIH26_00320, partial [Anaerolineales bacterium]
PGSSRAHEHRSGILRDGGESYSHPHSFKDGLTIVSTNNIPQILREGDFVRKTGLVSPSILDYA